MRSIVRSIDDDDDTDDVGHTVRLLTGSRRSSSAVILFCYDVEGATPDNRHKVIIGSVDNKTEDTKVEIDNCYCFYETANFWGHPSLP